MSGTMYRSPAPGEPPFVKEGDRVTKGQTIAIIEAMKLMNEIEVCPLPAHAALDKHTRQGLIPCCSSQCTGPWRRSFWGGWPTVARPSAAIDIHNPAIMLVRQYVVKPNSLPHVEAWVCIAVHTLSFQQRCQKEVLYLQQPYVLCVAQSETAGIVVKFITENGASVNPGQVRANATRFFR